MKTRQTRQWFALLTVALMSAACTTAAGARADDVESPRDLAVAAPESVGLSSTRVARLEAGMRQFVEDGRLAGVHTLLARHGKIVSSSVAGVTSVENGTPLTEDAIYLIYSMSKPITGVAMMMLYEEGKWRLNDPVTKFIPEFENLQVYSGDGADGEPLLEDANRSMTMRELMTHSSGLAYGLGSRNAVDRMYRESGVLDFRNKPLQSMIDTLAETPLLYQPGERWYYSIAVDVQGYLVEKLSGQPFDEFLQERIFAPLGMVDTAFYVPADKLDRLALIHGENEDGTLNVQQNGDPTQMPAGPSGGGGLYSTTIDYMRFSQMVLNGGALNGVRLLAPRSVEMMRTNHLEEQALSTMGPGSGFGLDFGVVMDPAAAGEPYSKGSFRWGGAAGTWFWIDPVEDFVFVGMIQHRGRAVGDVQGVSRNLTYSAIID
ncbi:MAG: serine hydrolase [Vicinamibacterales bacterium]|nr:serine hydrolase [Vicinamibacterales bacterium]